MPTRRGRATGVGLCYHPFLQKHVLERADALDFVEIAATQYLNPAQQRLLDRDGSRLDDITLRRPCIVRGNLLSIGSVEPVDSRALLRLREMLERTGAASFSDDLAFDRLDTMRLGIPQAPPYCDSAARWVARRYEAVRRSIGSPFILEIVAYPFPAPLSCWTEIEFIVRVAEYTDCALSLDLAALLINSHNHQYDPLEFLWQLPGDRIAQIRIGGVDRQSGEWRHDRGRPASDEIFELLDAALEATDADRVIVGREGGYFPFSEVIAEVTRVRQVYLRHRKCIPEDRRHFAAGRRAGEGGTMPDKCDELDEEFSALRGYQYALLKCCLSAAGDPPGLQTGEGSDMIESVPAARLRSLVALIEVRSGAAAYLKEISQERELVAWMMRDARARR
jgi:uncharacterized protein (UPF0276 family)